MSHEDGCKRPQQMTDELGDKHMPRSHAHERSTLCATTPYCSAFRIHGINYGFNSTKSSHFCTESDLISSLCHEWGCKRTVCCKRITFEFPSSDSIQSKAHSHSYEHIQKTNTVRIIRASPLICDRLPGSSLKSINSFRGNSREITKFTFTLNFFLIKILNFLF